MRAADASGGDVLYLLPPACEAPIALKAPKAPKAPLSIPQLSVGCLSRERACWAVSDVGLLNPLLYAGFLGTGVLLRSDADAWGVSWGGVGGVGWLGWGSWGGWVGGFSATVLLPRACSSQQALCMECTGPP